MIKNQIMILGEKETFLIRVLEKKIQDNGMNCEYVSWTVDSINAKWESAGLITLYMEEGVQPSENVLHFLADKMIEDGKQLIAIGEKSNIEFISDEIPKEVLYRTYLRPLDNEGYINTAKDLFRKVASGEFKKTVLVVDDDPNYLSHVREWLKANYKVAMANSGLQALKWLGKNKADLILLDYEMPVTTGPQVLEMLRSEDETRSIPVMFLTSKQDKQSVMSVLDLKPEGYFLKSIEKDELLKNLEDFFTKKKV